MVLCSTMKFIDNILIFKENRGRKTPSTRERYFHSTISATQQCVCVCICIGGGGALSSVNRVVYGGVHVCESGGGQYGCGRSEIV